MLLETMEKVKFWRFLTYLKAEAIELVEWFFLISVIFVYLCSFLV